MMIKIKPIVKIIFKTLSKPSVMLLIVTLFTSVGFKLSSEISDGIVAILTGFAEILGTIIGR